MSKEIKVLTDVEHIRHRPEMYIGRVQEEEEKVPFISDDGKIEFRDFAYSVGLYKILDEVIDNAYDEAKRQHGKMEKIVVELDTKLNKVSVRDFGGGFKNGHVVRTDTGLSNVETAVTVLRAGSNFDNTEEETLIGMHGVGVSCTNVLSKEFTITTIEKNSGNKVSQHWDNFIPSGPLKRERCTLSELGTVIEFIPSTVTFKDYRYDPEFLASKLRFKKTVLKYDFELSKVNLQFIVDGREVNLDVNIIPDGSVIVSSKLGLVAVLPQYTNSGSVSFVNSAMCTGIHQTIIKQQLASVHKEATAYQHFDTLIILNLPPSLARFASQNKDRLATSRSDLEPFLDLHFGKRLLKEYKSSDLKAAVDQHIIDSKTKSGLKEIKKKQRSASQIKLSDKYFPPADSKNRLDLFISEGFCIDANEKIRVIRENTVDVIPISNIRVGDFVVTHKNRFREVVGKTNKLNSVLTIKMSDGTVVKSTKDHRFYLFNTNENQFEFVKVNEIDRNVHKFVKNKVSNFSNSHIIEDITVSEDAEYSHVLHFDNMVYIKSTADHLFCILKEGEFIMMKAKNLSPGDEIVSFSMKI